MPTPVIIYVPNISGSVDILSLVGSGSISLTVAFFPTSKLLFKLYNPIASALDPPSVFGSGLTTLPLTSIMNSYYYPTKSTRRDINSLFS